MSINVQKYPIEVFVMFAPPKRSQRSPGAARWSCVAACGRDSERRRVARGAPRAERRRRFVGKKGSSRGKLGGRWGKNRGNLFELVRCENLSCLEGGLFLGKYVEQLIPFFHAIDHECR